MRIIELYAGSAELPSGRQDYYSISPVPDEHYEGVVASLGVSAASIGGAAVGVSAAAALSGLSAFHAAGEVVVDAAGTSFEVISDTFLAGASVIQAAIRQGASVISNYCRATSGLVVHSTSQSVPLDQFPTLIAPGSSVLPWMGGGSLYYPPNDDFFYQWVEIAVARYTWQGGQLVHSSASYSLPWRWAWGAASQYDEYHIMNQVCTYQVLSGEIWAIHDSYCPVYSTFSQRYGVVNDTQSYSIPNGSTTITSVKFPCWRGYHRTEYRAPYGGFPGGGGTSGGGGAGGTWTKAQLAGQVGKVSPGGFRLLVNEDRLLVNGKPLRVRKGRGGNG